jgi:hypothetical protein
MTASLVRRLAPWSLVLLATLAHQPLRAASPEATVPAPVEVAHGGDPDFLFRAPLLSLTLRGGLFDYRGSGQFFSTAVRDFTLDPSDFRSLEFGAELALAMNNRIDLIFGLDGGTLELSHQSRDWEETDGSPIRQNTRIRNGPAAQFGIKGYLLPRGDQLSSFSWVPATVVPFVAGGVGYMGYEVRQWGDFVFTTSNGGAFIQRDDLQGEGGAPLLFLSGGADVTLRPRLALTVEGRYRWADNNLRGDFYFDDPLDLSGLRVSLGLTARF